MQIVPAVVDIRNCKLKYKIKQTSIDRSLYKIMLNVLIGCLPGMTISN